jgi:hypothetical protein
MQYRSSANNAWQAFRRVYWTLAGAMAIVLVLLAVLGFGPGGRNCKPMANTASAGSAAGMAAAHPHEERLACRVGGPPAVPRS